MELSQPSLHVRLQQTEEDMVKRVSPWKGSMESLPEEVIGNILSHVASARDVMIASATNRKWLRAAKDYLHTLTFDASDFVAKHGGLRSVFCEGVITRTVLRTKCLNSLSIGVEPSSIIQFQAGPVIEWLLHTKETLTSLTIMNPIEPGVNILEILGDGHSKLEHLKWGWAYIPAIDPSIHRFESLVFLILSSIKTWLTAANLQALLISCPNLESLLLIDIHIGEEDRDAPQKTLLNLKSSSLKAFCIDEGFEEVDSMVLSFDNLDVLWLKAVEFEQVKLVQSKDCNNLRQLSVENAIIAKLDIEGSAHSLQQVNISALSVQDEWPLYYQIISRSIDLRKLSLSSTVANRGKGKSIVDLSQIASSFPQLHFLGLTYQHAYGAFKDGESAELVILKSVVVLELYTYRFNTQFATWVGAFLERCPNLKQLTISGKAYWGDDDDRMQEMADYTSLIVPIMRPYPHIDLKISYA